MMSSSAAGPFAILLALTSLCFITGWAVEVADGDRQKHTKADWTHLGFDQ